MLLKASESVGKAALIPDIQALLDKAGHQQDQIKVGQLQNGVIDSVAKTRLHTPNYENIPLEKLTINENMKDQEHLKQTRVVVPSKV